MARSPISEPDPECPGLRWSTLCVSSDYNGIGPRQHRVTTDDVDPCPGDAPTAQTSSHCHCADTRGSSDLHDDDSLGDNSSGTAAAHLDPRRKRRSGAGRKETAPLRLERRRPEGGGGRTSGHRRYSIVGIRPGVTGPGFSASEWPGCGSVNDAVRRADARRDRGRSTLPVTRAGSRAGPFRSIPCGHRQEP
jgi:hypothetical protein